MCIREVETTRHRPLMIKDTKVNETDYSLGQLTNSYSDSYKNYMLIEGFGLILIYQK